MAAAKAKVKSRRAEVRADRQSRRAEIEARWTARAAKTLFQESLSAASSREHLTHVLMFYGQWVDRRELLDLYEFRDLKAFTAHLLRIIELKEMPYDDYLQTPEWKECAAIAKARLGGSCALDASHSAEHAHHRTYARRGRERPEDLIGLCAECHAKFHGKVAR